MNDNTEVIYIFKESIFNWIINNGDVNFILDYYNEGLITSEQMKYLLDMIL
jgi:hypothetical protein